MRVLQSYVAGQWQAPTGDGVCGSLGDAFDHLTGQDSPHP